MSYPDWTYCQLNISEVSVTDSYNCRESNMNIKIRFPMEIDCILDRILLLYGNCLVANQDWILATNLSEGLGKNMLNFTEK